MIWHTGKLTRKLNSSAYDVHAAKAAVIEPRTRQLISTGVRISLPKDVCAMVVGRSGLALKGIDVHYGLIDEDYRGEIGVIVKNETDEPFVIEEGDRIAQLLILRSIKGLVRVAELNDETDRGDGGFGSTGV